MFEPSSQTSTAPEPAAVAAPESTQEVAPTPTMRESLEATFDRLNPPRGQDGKFATTEAKPEAPALAVEPEAAVSDQPQEQGNVEPAQPAIDAPNSWSADMKAKWAGLPPDVQRYVADREGQAHKAITQQGEMVRAFQPVAEVFHEYRDEFAKQNVTPVQGISYLLGMHRQFMATPVAVIQQLADDAGIDLSQLAEYSRSQPRPDPEVTALKRELGEVKQHLTASQRAQQDTQMAEAARDLEKFAEGKPHFDAVRQHMGALLAAGLATTLDEAYEQATAAHPDVRKRIQEDQRKADEAKRAEEAAKAAKAAKQAAGVNVRSKAAAAPGPKGSLRETMEATYDRLNS